MDDHISSLSLSYSDLKNVLSQSGAKVLSREPRPENFQELTGTGMPDIFPETCSIRDLRLAIICGVKVVGNEKVFQQISAGVYHVSVEWIVSCICSFSIVDEPTPSTK